MYVNPIPFGIFLGVVGTIALEVVALIIYALWKGNKN